VRKRIVTVVDAVVDEAREAELVEGYQRMAEGDRPEGILRSELLRGQGGSWRILTTWQDMDALMAVRKSGYPPAAQELLKGVGAQQVSHDWYTVEQSFDQE
jgi:heme-degrading monooxygenase HmoA